MNNSILFGLGALPVFKLDTTVRHEFSKLTFKYTKKLYSDSQLRTSNEIHRFLKTKIFNADDVEYRESAYAVYLDNANNVVGYMQLAIGARGSVTLDPHILFSGALACGAHGIFICHNHPSGNMKPSPSDISVTSSLKKAARILSLTIIDQYIYSPQGLFSILMNRELSI